MTFVDPFPNPSKRQPALYHHPEVPTSPSATWKGPMNNLRSMERTVYLLREGHTVEKKFSIMPAQALSDFLDGGNPIEVIDKLSGVQQLDYERFVHIDPTSPHFGAFNMSKVYIEESLIKRSSKPQTHNNYFHTDFHVMNYNNEQVLRISLNQAEGVEMLEFVSDFVDNDKNREGELIIEHTIARRVEGWGSEKDEAIQQEILKRQRQVDNDFLRRRGDGMGGGLLNDVVRFEIFKDADAERGQDWVVEKRAAWMAKRKRVVRHVLYEEGVGPVLTYCEE